MYCGIRLRLGQILEYCNMSYIHLRASTHHAGGEMMFSGLYRQPNRADGIMSRRPDTFVVRHIFPDLL